MRFRVILSRYSSRLFPGLSDSHDQRRGPFKTPLSLLVPFFNIYFLRHFFRGCLYFFPGSKFVLSLSLSLSRHSAAPHHPSPWPGLLFFSSYFVAVSPRYRIPRGFFQCATQPTRSGLAESESAKMASKRATFDPAIKRPRNPKRDRR